MTSATSRAAMWLPVAGRLSPLQAAPVAPSAPNRQTGARPHLLEFEPKGQPTDVDQREEVE